MHSIMLAAAGQEPGMTVPHSVVGLGAPLECGVFQPLLEVALIGIGAQLAITGRHD
jgi:hypothetical protein